MQNGGVQHLDWSISPRNTAGKRREGSRASSQKPSLKGNPQWELTCSCITSAGQGSAPQAVLIHTGRLITAGETSTGSARSNSLSAADQKCLFWNNYSNHLCSVSRTATQGEPGAQTNSIFLVQLWAGDQKCTPSLMKICSKPLSVLWLLSIFFFNFFFIVSNVKGASHVGRRVVALHGGGRAL